MGSGVLSKRVAIRRIIRQGKGLAGNLPYGELIINPQCFNKCINELSGIAEVANIYGLFFIGARSPSEAKYLHEATECFVFGLVTGPFSCLMKKLNFTSVLKMMHSDSLSFQSQLLHETKAITKLINEYVDNGADGVVIADDICYSKGLLFQEGYLDNIFLPIYEGFSAQITSRGLTAAFHSCGRVDSLLDKLPNAGFGVFHGFDYSYESLEFFHLPKVGLVLMGGCDPYHMEGDIKDFVTRIYTYTITGYPYLICSSGGIATKKDAQKMMAFWNIMKIGGV